MFSSDLEVFGGQAGGNGSDDCDFLAVIIPGRRDGVSRTFLVNHFSGEAFEVLDADRFVQITPLTPVLTRVRTNQAANPGEGVVLSYYFNCFLVTTLTD